MRRIPWLAVCVVCAACGQRPADPSSSSDTGTPDPLPDGRYTLQIVAPAMYQGCTPALANPFVVSHASHVLLSRDPAASGWIARSVAASAGDVELRFHPVAIAARSVALSGTIRGTIVNVIGMDGIVGLGVSFGSDPPAVEATGTWISNTVPVTGKLSGPIAFIEDGETRTICPTADWLLQADLM